MTKCMPMSKVLSPLVPSLEFINLFYGVPGDVFSPIDSDRLIVLFVLFNV